VEFGGAASLEDRSQADGVNGDLEEFFHLEQRSHGKKA